MKQRIVGSAPASGLDREPRPQRLLFFMASLAATIRGVRLERGFASFRKECCRHKTEDERFFQLDLCTLALKSAYTPLRGMM
ncbi:hypothetical protein XENOCAPTIV_002972 [Xenoophorus captivus]|uniref:Transposase n=1 Tax=Xenoophorus captivus TaxID=1517983 RepID=A0ABV0R7R8_9TELE